MAVTVDATAAAVTQGTGVATASSTNLTVTASATALLVWLEFAQNIPTGLTVRWDNTGTPQAMTLVASATNSGGTTYCALYGLLAPTSGAKTLNATWTGNAAFAMMSISFRGTDTSSIANAFKNANSNTGTSASATVTGTSATGNINVAGCCNTTQNMSSLAATGSTSVFVDNSHAATSGARATGAASVAWTGTVAASAAWAIACIDVSVPATVTQTPYQPQYQLAPMLAQ